MMMMIWTFTIHHKLKGSVHKQHKCKMCSLGKTRLKFARFIRDVFLQILGLQACNRPIYTVTFGSTRRLQTDNFYHAIVCICLEISTDLT